MSKSPMYRLRPAAVILALSAAPPLATAACAQAPTDAKASQQASAPSSQSADDAHRARSPHTLGAPGTVQAGSPALAQLARESAALDLVQRACARALPMAAKRVAAMHAFIEQAGQAGAFARFADGWQPMGAQITFHQAVDAALDHLGPRPVLPASRDVGAAEQSVQVATLSAQQSFDQLNALRRSGETLGAFLRQAGLLNGYFEWVQRQPATMANASSPLPDGPDRQSALDERALQLGWDAAQHRAFQQTAPALEPGLAVAHGPYSTTWWNSYADPYYDISGTPGGAPSPQARSAAPDDGSWQVPGYDRSSWPVYPELGPNVVPAFGVMPTGAAGGAVFGGTR